jgi:hypothetical protein
MDFAATKGEDMADLKVSSVADIKNMVDDEVVYCFQGKLKDAGKFFPPDPNDSTKGSFQIVTLLDPTGQSIKSVVKGHDEITKAVFGKPVSLTAYHGDRGWSGLKAKDNKYNKKDVGEVVERVLWITKTATIDFSGATPTQMPLPASKPVVAPPAAPQSVSSDAVEHVKAARIEIAKRVNLQDLILDGVMALAVRANERGYTMGADHMQAVCSTLFISMERAGFVERMPVGPVQQYVAKAKAPAPKPQPVDDDPFAPGTGSDDISYEDVTP